MNCGCHFHLGDVCLSEQASHMDSSSSRKACHMSIVEATTSMPRGSLSKLVKGQEIGGQPFPAVQESSVGEFQLHSIANGIRAINVVILIP